VDSLLAEPAPRRRAEDLERLRAEHDQAPVEQKCRNGVDPDRLRLLCRRLDDVAVRRRVVEHAVDVVRLEPDLRRQPP
jgi:hypothetical protein